MAQPNAWFRSSLLQKRAGLQNILKSRIGKWSRRNLCFFFTEDEVKNIKRKARKIIPERIGYWAEKIGVTYGRIAIRLQSSRWGSCAANGNLNFNCLLVLMPSEVLDSVVVHELCHRRHMNHSKEFYAEIDRVFPDYRRWNKWLKDNGGVYLKRVGK